MKKIFLALLALLVSTFTWMPAVHAGVLCTDPTTVDTMAGMHTRMKMDTSIASIPDIETLASLCCDSSHTTVCLSVVSEIATHTSSTELPIPSPVPVDLSYGVSRDTHEYRLSRTVSPPLNREPPTLRNTYVHLIGIVRSIR